MLDIGSFILIFLLSMLKFIAGPTLGLAAGFTLFETILVTVLGMMTSVFIFTFLGEVMRDKLFRRYYRSKTLFNKRNRRFVLIWRKYGIFGVAFLTPVIFTPIGGTILLTAFGSPRAKILSFMLISSIFWAVSISAFLKLMSDQVKIF